MTSPRAPDPGSVATTFSGLLVLSMVVESPVRATLLSDAPRVAHNDLRFSLQN